MIKKNIFSFVLGIALCLSASAQNEEENQLENYVIDIKGMHAFIEFRVKHLGYSWLLGRFNTFYGTFIYDENNQSNNKLQIDIDVSSLDSNHAERDKHLRGSDYLDTAKFPKAIFISTAYEDKGNGKGIMHGDFTLRGITKKLAINVQQIGAGDDPWGGYRRGFEGVTTLHLSDYKMLKSSSLGPASENIELFLYIEGIRQ